MSYEEEKDCDCVPGLPPWMGTFADLMSLLMCFFVLLLSFSEMDAVKFKRLAGSMAQAFGVQNKLQLLDIPKGTSIIAQEFSPGRPEATPINEIWQKTEDITEMSLEVECAQEFNIEQGQEGYDAGVTKSQVMMKLQELIGETEQDAFQLADALSEQILAGEVEIETRGRLIIVRIREKGSFISGSAEMAPSYKDVMSEVKSVLAQKPGKIEVQGHTDNVPINSSRFRSNWELSSSRAASVAMELMKGGVIPERRFEISGFADTAPLAPDNSTADNRARNRRVEILIKQGLESELEDDDIELLKENRDGADILRELKLEPEYLFDLEPEEIF
ncbi:MAG: chemotaxis protein MotB [Lentisphaeria bacterium]|jgi:chemotaxis protein MotB